jgi:hypothetical protein
MDREWNIQEYVIACSIMPIWLLGIVCFWVVLIQAVSACYSSLEAWRNKKKSLHHLQSTGVGLRIQFVTASSAEEGIQTKVCLFGHQRETLVIANLNVFKGCPPLCAWTYNQMGELLITFQEANPKWQTVRVESHTRRLSLECGPDILDHPPSYCFPYFLGADDSCKESVSFLTLDIVLPAVRLELFGPTTPGNFWSTPQDVLHKLDANLSHLLPPNILKIVTCYILHFPHHEERHDVEVERDLLVPKCMCLENWANHDNRTEKGQRILAMSQVEGWQSFWTHCLRL